MAKNIGRQEISCNVTNEVICTLGEQVIMEARCHFTKESSCFISFTQVNSWNKFDHFTQERCCYKQELSCFTLPPHSPLATYITS